MAITGQQVINVGLPNESANSDSLYTAFTKANVNFQTLFACASPYNTFTAGDGVNVVASNNVVTVTNTGVLNILAGTGVTVSSANGNVTISANAGGGNGGGTVTSVGLNPVSNTRLTVTGSPVVSAGNINIDLATSGATAGSYTNPNVSVDAYGRVTSIANGSIAGTVTSVGLTPGAGIQISGGPITSNGNITVTNTGVTRVNAGSGIALSGGNGNVTISATSLGGTVTSVGISSSQLVVSGSPVVNSGTISVNLPNSATFTGTVTAGNVAVTGNLTYNPTWGSFYSNVTQTNPTPNTAMAMTLNNTFSANNISIASGSRITIAKTGVYNIQFSAQLEKTDAGTDYVSIWLNKNGNLVAATNTEVKLTGGGDKQVASWNFVEEVTVANTYYQVMWSSADANAQIRYQGTQSSPARPATPSVIVTVTSVGA